MDVYEAIRARRTIRDFEDRQVGMGTIERIIDAGLKAPQPLRIGCKQLSR